MMNIVNFLSRDDKHYLGGGNRLLWTPNFPQWLDKPGFWDKAHYYNLEIEPVFTLTFLDEKGNELPLNLKQRRWFPSHIRNLYNRVDGLDIVEEKTLFENDILASSISLTNTGEKQVILDCILWKLHRNSTEKNELTNIESSENGFCITQNIDFRQETEYEVECFLGLNSGVDSRGVYVSNNTSVTPEWKYTPMIEKFNGKLIDGVEGEVNAGERDIVYLGVHSKIILRANEHKNILAFFAASNKREDTKKSVDEVMSIKHPIVHNMNNWKKYFDDLPGFSCSDKYIEKYYWYRWYGLKLNTLRENDYDNMKYPAVTEGPGYFRGFISYSAQCHILETRWMKDPELAQGTVNNFISTQREDGCFTGHIYPKYLQPESFYHSNWGNVIDLYHVHEDKVFLKDAYDGLRKYLDYFKRERDREDSGLYDVLNHYETGQEFMSRYHAVDQEADRDNWGSNFRLKGVDATVYIYELKKVLLEIAGILSIENDIDLLISDVERTKNAVLNSMWDPEQEMFFDVDPSNGQRTSIKAAVNFYPYLTDIVSENHLPGLKRHLLNPDEFWTEYPIPSSSVDDELFSPYGDWKGKRLVCPWNGRVWPMTNSHIADALARSAMMFNDSELRARTVEFINKFIRMMFFDGDIEKPNCFEHYNPNSGKPSVFRGIDDYQHSWVVDLIIKYICGIRPEKDKIIIDPFPFEIDHFLIDRLYIRGKMICVERNKDKFKVNIDSKEHAERPIGESIEIII